MGLFGWIKRDGTPPPNLRCRPLDMAVLTRECTCVTNWRGIQFVPLRVGTIVQVDHAWADGKWQLVRSIPYAVWSTSHPDVEVGGIVTAIADECLRPLRGGDGVDETLRADYVREGIRRALRPVDVVLAANKSHIRGRVT